MRKTIWFLIGFVLIAGCYNPGPPSRVYIPGPDASVSITVSVSSNQTAVNEPVILYASRTTSGFVEVPFSQVPEGVRWWRRMPPAHEEEVAGNLRWIVKPEGKARFNTDFRSDFTREVRFTEPGTYELYGVSAGYGPEPVASETIVIKVVR